MPLDRRIKIASYGPWRPNPDTHENERGAIRIYELWAGVLDADTTSRLDDAGVRTLTDKTFRIRFNSALLLHNPSDTFVKDDYGIFYAVVSVKELTDSRRRWMDIEGVRLQFGNVPAGLRSALS